MVEPGSQFLVKLHPPSYPLVASANGFAAISDAIFLWRFFYGWVWWEIGKTNANRIIEQINKAISGAHQTYFKCKSLKLKKVRIGSPCALFHNGSTFGVETCWSPNTQQFRRRWREVCCEKLQKARTFRQAPWWPQKRGEATAGLLGRFWGALGLLFFVQKKLELDN